MKVRVKVVYPLKQGLKRMACVLYNGHKHVKVVYPLKQGLKLSVKLTLPSILFIVKVVYPLKQGLKPHFHHLDLPPSLQG